MVNYDPSKRYEISHFIQMINELESELEQFEDNFELYFIASLDEDDPSYGDYSKEEHELADSISSAKWALDSLTDDFKSFQTWYDKKL